MAQADSGNARSYDKKKNKDDEAEATPPPTDGRTVWIRPRLGWEEQLRQICNSMAEETLVSDPHDLEGMTPPRVSECITCKRQFLSQDFCDCHRRLTPIKDKFPLKSLPAKARPGSPSWLPDPTRSNLSGGGTSTTHNHGSSGEVVGFAHEHGNIEMEGMHSSDDVQGGPTLELRGDSSSHGFADENSDIERGPSHSSDGVPSEPRLVDPSSNHRANEDTWQRFTTMADPLLSVNVQGALSLVAYKSSDASSPSKDVLLYLLVFVYVLGFLSALAGKFYPRSKMGVIGLGAAALGFLMTMALVVVHKI